MKKLFRNLFTLETLLGISLGLGYLTSLRFTDKVGISELLFLIIIIVLSKKYLSKVFDFKHNKEGRIRLYLFFSFFILTPYITFTYYYASDYNSTPIYLVSFAMSLLLMYLLNEAQKHDFNFKTVVIWFAFTFIITNFISIFIFNDNQFRYTGGAKNPNQLMFYSNSLFILLAVFHKRLFLLATPIIIFIMLKTKSDTFNLTLFVVALFYIVFKLTYIKRAPFYINLIIGAFIFIIPVSLVYDKYADEIEAIWYDADEGGSRQYLMKNAFEVSKESPLFGYGTGSFSGINAPFGNSEAHNTFLDLSMQFGFIVPIIFYLIMIAYLIKNLKNGDFLVAAVVLAYIISSMFHFTGRHFIFWVELSIFYHNVFYNKKQYYVRN